MLPYLEFNLDKLLHNTKTITGLCASLGIQVSSVTKVCGGIPEIGGVMLKGGVRGLADSRLLNIKRLRQAGITAEIMLLRSPALSEVDQVVELADISLNSELQVLQQLSRVANQMGKVHQIILMVDLGDLREGVWPDKFRELYDSTRKLPGLEISGVGTNFGCYGGVLPSQLNMEQLTDLVRSVNLGCGDYLVSGGNSSALHLISHGQWVTGIGQINHFRIGESIFLGWDIIDKCPLDNCYQDACLLHAEIIEVQTKPSQPVGEIAVNAFGERPYYVDRGRHRRGIIALGRQDIGFGNITPLRREIEVLGASSDHIILDVEHAPDLRVGDVVTFTPDYGALLATATSNYIAKKLTQVN